ncbi:uncharacterized protein V1510DRAFT_410602 [Dipodascopsis tothii]|uniref:uncharacterized protein n=1 Tax=Dipodascopsis tothii TaxID=44089 RepID=UPI0034CE4A7E
MKFSYTLWSPSDTVRDVAESLGIVNLPEDVAKALAMDIEYRIHELLEQALKFMRHGKRTHLTTSDISHAMRVLNVEPLYGYDSSRPVRFREAILGPGQTLYYIDDDVVDFEKIINMPLPKVPREVSFTAHWLAIEGVQPSIPQNPAPSDVTKPAGQSSMLPAGEVEVKPLVKHALSKELQLYFDRVIAALTEESDDSAMKTAALNSLRNDAGLHQLVPYFIQFAAEKITNNLGNASLLYLILQVLHALVTNPTIFIEPYIHSIMPLILTLLVAKKIGSPQPGSLEHFEVRDFASSILQYICTQYGDSYHTLKPRVTRTLFKAFMDNKKPLGTHYGAISGLTSIGPEVVRVVVLGNLREWSKVIGHQSGISQPEKARLGKVVVEALRALVDKEMTTISEVSAEGLARFRDIVGDDVAALVQAEHDGDDIIKAIIQG